MGTLSTTVDKVRIRIIENKTRFFSDDDFLSLANDSIQEIFDELVGMECKLVANYSEQTLVAATAEYTITGIDTLIPEMVYVDEVEVPVYDPLRPDELSYEQTSTGIKFYNHDDGQDALIWYWGPVPVLTDFDNDDLPWEGIWNNAIMRSLVVETKEIRTKKVNNTAALATSAAEKAMNRSVARYGTIQRIIRTRIKDRR